MKKYLIIARLESLEFPLREATRKQIWWDAKAKSREGYDVEILILSNFNESTFVDDIKIKHVNRWRLFLTFKSNRIHFVSGSVNIWLLVLLFHRKFKELTLTDGDMLGANWKLFRRFIIIFLPLVYHKIFVFSNYQKNRLGLKKTEIKTPLLPKINVDKSIQRSENPTLLYMGHLSYFKGIDTIIKSFKALIIEVPKIELIIANNSIRGDKDLIDQISELKKEYPDNITLKGVVNPIVELLKAWVYLYPFKQPLGTMAFALSLYEAESCNTPFVACDIGANKEFFNNDYLISVDDHASMTNKIKAFIDERKNL